MAAYPARAPGEQSLPPESGLRCGKLPDRDSHPEHGRRRNLADDVSGLHPFNRRRMRYTAAVRGRTAKQQSDNVRAAAGLALFLTLAVVLASCREGAFQPSSTPSDLTIDRPSAAPGPNLVVSKVVATDLGTLPGGASSAAFDVNDQGQIVGEGTTASGATHAFIMT